MKKIKKVVKKVVMPVKGMPIKGHMSEEQAQKMAFMVGKKQSKRR